MEGEGEGGCDWFYGDWWEVLVGVIGCVICEEDWRYDTNLPGFSLNRGPCAYLADRLHLCLRFFLGLLVEVCAGRGESRC